MSIDVLLIGMNHAPIDGTARIQVIASADESGIVGRCEMIVRFVLAARAVTALVFLQQLRSAPVDWNSSPVVDGNSSRLVLAKNLFVLILVGQIDRRDALVLRCRVQRAVGRGGRNVCEFRRPGFAVLLLVLTPLGCNDEIDGQDENEQRDADARNDGRPVNGAQSASSEPLGGNVIDREGSCRPDRSRGCCCCRWTGHPQLDQVGNPASIATSVHCSDGRVKPAIVAIEIH